MINISKLAKSIILFHNFPPKNDIQLRTDNTISKKKDKQRSTKHTHKTKDRVTRTPLKSRVLRKGG
jgi:hypothetical protein